VTRGLIARIAGGVQGAKLCSQVVAWNAGATREQVAEAFQEACTRAVRSCRGQSEGEVYVWLRTTTHHELGHLRRRARMRATRELPVCEPSVSLNVLTPPAASAEDEVIERERLAEVEHLTGAVLARLDERQRQIAALHSHGCRRPEIARHLGITQRSVKRALERIMALSRAELVRRAGNGCGSGERLVSRLAFGLAGEREIREAQLHLATCPRCGAMYERLDLWREKVAALLPLPAIAHTQPRLIERVAHTVADHLPRPGGDSGTLRNHVLEAGARLKQQATVTAARVADPTPMAGVRPGAVAAAVAGCLAIGGGATYCLQRGVDPVRAVGAAHRATPTPTPTPQRRTRVSPTPSPAATPASTPLPTVAATHKPQPIVATATPNPTATPAPQEEYEPMAVGSASNSSQKTASKPRTPAPAPAGGPGEFDGP
jgi:RNA polymerase sigma factor (sigma-70 family)